jgi:hypothetical protein
MDGFISLKFSKAQTNRQIPHPEQFSCIAFNSTLLELHLTDDPLISQHPVITKSAPD